MRIGSKLSAALSRVTSCSPNDDASEETLLMKMLRMGITALGIDKDSGNSYENVDDLTTRGMKCYERYKEFGRLEDATAAIQIYCEAISLAPEGHPDKPTMINNLALSFCGRYELLGDVADLDTAIGFLKEAVAYAQEGNPDDQALSNLGAAYSSRYDRLGRLEDLDMSINCLSRAVSSTPTVDPTWLSNLGTVHGSRFENLGNSEDLDKAIHYLTLAIALAEGDLDAPTRLDNIGYSYHQRFETTGRLEDLDMAINYACQAVSDLPKSHPHQRIWLSNLGAWYQTRFQRLGNLSDIDLAIDRLAQAVSFTPEGHTDRPGPLNNLALSYRSRFERLGQLEDLDRSIDSLTQAVSQTPDDHIDKPVFFNSLGLAYQSRFDTSEELADLHSAIHCFSQAISQTPDEYTQQAIWLHNLGRAYQDRFDRLGELEDLERAIDFSSRAVSLTPETHPIMALLLGHLSGSYEDLYTYTQCMEHLHHAVGCARRAAESVVGDPSTKFAAARIWALESDLHDLPSLLEAHQQAMDLIPQIVWLGADTHRRYETVAGLDDVAIEAVIAAIRYQEYDLALVWSEQGRSIVWTQLLELRTPFDQLYEIDPILARELRQVTQDLELAESGTLSRSELSTDQAAIEQVAQQHRRLAERREQLITEARKLPGMNDLLRANSAASLFAAAKAGAVVVVVIHERGCYALVIRPNCTHTSCVALTRLTHSKISAARDVLTPAIHSQGRISRHVVYRPDAAPGVEGILYMLWTDLVNPVLEFLGYRRALIPDRLPSITWCTTGPLTFLPLHAAGDYSREGCSLFDYAVSSFAPTLSCLLATPSNHHMPPGIVTIGLAQTPGLSSLPGTTRELDTITEQLQSSIPISQLTGHEATISATLAALDTHSWAHFACHASQNVSKPTASAFHLHDGPLELAVITRRQLKCADLAFLSACQTAMGEETMPEENVHLAAGMIMAGYRRVIATLWSINDADAPLVAAKFYTYMMSEEVPKDKKAARALHYAVGCLREQVGIQQIGRWAPYVHMGL